jgi:ATP-dependent RNA helicase RhlE
LRRKIFKKEIMYYTKYKKRKSKNFSGDTNRSGDRPSGRSRGRKKESTISSDLLIKKAEIVGQDAYRPARSFEQWPVDNRVKHNLSLKGYQNPTQIQEETIEHLIAGRDLLGIANTGTGKTGAFLIPIIEQLLRGPRPFSSLVIVPTRELALQVEMELKSLSRGLKIYSASFIGGTSINRDLSRLRQPFHISIGTPGRLLDLANRGAFKLSDTSVLVLDEFDRMLDMGFVKDVQKLVSAMSNRRQTMLFSATLDHTQRSLIDQLLTDPVEVKVSNGDTTTKQVDQDVIRVPREGDKFAMLLDLIAQKEFEKVLIFAETKRLVDRVTRRLNGSGVAVDQIHGNKTQNYRIKALDKFRKGRVKVLVATDVAARGIDITDITHVINYQIPMSYDSYIHRIGRTGRAGKTGKAITFVDQASKH